MKEEKKFWEKPVIEYLIPLNKWENIDVIDESIYFNGHVYQDKILRAHNLVVVLEYEDTFIVLDNGGRFIAELNKNIREG